MTARLPDEVWPVLDGGVNSDLLDVDWMRDTLLPALRAALARARAEGAREAADEIEKWHRAPIGSEARYGWNLAREALREMAAGVATAPTEPATVPTWDHEHEPVTDVRTNRPTEVCFTCCDVRHKPAAPSGVAPDATAVEVEGQRCRCGVLASRCIDLDECPADEKAEAVVAEYHRAQEDE